MTKILVADDDPYARELIRVVAGDEAGNEILEAANGVDALRLALLERPEVAFIDVRMPDLNGFEVCRAIKADPITRTIHVLLFAGLDDTQVMAQALAAGADGFFRKPLTPQALRRHLQALQAE
jgi:two-component system, sensor histidine kinase and response regulator